MHLEDATGWQCLEDNKPGMQEISPTKGKDLKHDKCDLCEERATHGVISIHHHKSLCKKHYFEYRRDDDAPKPKKKREPSKLEKEFKNAGLKVSPRNSGTQLVLAKKFTKVDYWPTTQRWFNRSTGESGVGKKGVFTNFGL